MKLDQQSRNNLRDAIRARLSETGLKVTQVAKAADVDPGQASRICRGDFRTLSSSVMQICNILEIDTDARVRGHNQLDRRLIAGLTDLWDGTPEDSVRLSQLLAQLAKFRHGRDTHVRRVRRQNAKPAGSRRVAKPRPKRGGPLR